ncbi:MAG: alpha/beta hydrolase family protein, partial [Gemmataceae bacterium]
QVEKKAEKTPEGARYPLQARCAQLARMGCVVFHYDMVGYADSQAIGHGAFADVEAEMRLQNLMGLQTWNSIRALDFLTELPEVDSRRIGVTGASGGGTQTFILCAIDERPAAAFPAVMVSTEMQGGCVCENCSLLRIGTGNVEFAGLFAPKPLAMSAANDWTLNIEKQGYPQLKSLYRMLQAEDQVKARCWPEFDHNYNQPAREMMYNWFNKHLSLGLADPVSEKPFVPVPPKQLSVFDADHPRPGDSANATKLREYLTRISRQQLEQIKPTDAPGLQAYQSILRPALRAMLCDQLPQAAEVESREVSRFMRDDHEVTGLILGRKGSKEEVPGLFLRGKVEGGPVILWVDPAGKAGLFSGDSLRPEARSLLQRAGGILALDVFGTGELTPAKAMQLNTKFAGYTLGYNRPLLAQRVHDLLTGVGYLRGRGGVGSVRIL